MSTVHEIARLLTLRKLTIAVAEACTAGRLGHLLTSISGSSAYFQGGILSYSESVKRNVLGIDQEILSAEGSVSEVTALAMAQRVRELCGSAIGISTTGVAGPTGGTATKPVGLFYIALSTAEYQVCQRHMFSNGEREANRERAAQAALTLLHEYLDFGEFFT